MTTSELITKLTEADPSGGRIVILSKDEEGNGFKVVSEVATNSVFDPDEREVKIEILTEDLKKAGYSDADAGYGPEWIPAVVLWP